MTDLALRELDYGIMNAVQALIKMEAMKLQNKIDEKADRLPTYSPGDIEHLINELGLHHNALLTRWEGIR